MFDYRLHYAILAAEDRIRARTRSEGRSHPANEQVHLDRSTSIRQRRGTPALAGR